MREEHAWPQRGGLVVLLLLIFTVGIVFFGFAANAGPTVAKEVATVDTALAIMIPTVATFFTFYWLRRGVKEAIAGAIVLGYILLVFTATALDTKFTNSLSILQHFEGVVQIVVLSYFGAGAAVEVSRQISAGKEADAQKRKATEPTAKARSLLAAHSRAALVMQGRDAYRCQDPSAKAIGVLPARHAVKPSVRS